MNKKLRKYQLECVDALHHSTLGKVVLPTASGKTVIALDFLADRIEAGGRLFVVFVPRLLLAKQWIKKAANILLKERVLKVNFVNVNSSEISNKIKSEIEGYLYDNGFAVKPIISTTNSSEIVQAVEFQSQEDFAVIVVCTYHSSEVLLRAKLSFDTMFADEAHYIVSKELTQTSFSSCLEIVAERKYFLTATPRFTDSDQGEGMNNEEKFGPIIYEKKPREMIEVGAIVPPWVHFVQSRVEIHSDDKNGLANVVYAAFKRHREEVKSHSSEPDKIGAKLVVVCNGQGTLRKIMSSTVMAQIKKDEPQLNLYALCTEYGISINDVKMNPPPDSSDKEEFLSSLYGLENSDDAIIFHVDMIGEGLDVPSITGVMFLRSVSQTKFLQNEGRAGRPHPEDAARVESGELKPCNYAKYIKPHCWVILPYFLEDKDDFVTRCYGIVRVLRSDFGFDSSDHIINDVIHPATKDPGFPGTELERQARGKWYNPIDIFKDIEHTLETNQLEDDEALLVIRMKELTPEQQVELIRLLPLQSEIFSQTAQTAI